MIKILAIIFCGLFVLSINAQERSDTTKTNEIEYAFYPQAFYTPETQFAIGAGGMVYTRLGIGKQLPPSKMVFSTYYTTNKQYSFSILPSIYFGGNSGIISESKLIFNKEISKFYGIGNNTEEIGNPEYQMQLFRFYTEIGFETNIIDEIHFGFIYEFSSSFNMDKLTNTLLLNENLLGSEGGKTSGLGFVILIDHRDNVFYPTQNSFFKARVIFMGRDLGGDFTYNRMVVDYRRYFDVGNENIIASQVFIESTSGDVPFFKLALLGGSEIMRGYFLGRYRDELYLSWQIEYRKMFWWRLGAVAFWGVGDVAKKFNDLHLPELKYSYGFGLRYAFDEKENLNVRMDIGFGKNTSGVYFSLEEAF